MTRLILFLLAMRQRKLALQCYDERSRLMSRAARLTERKANRKLIDYLVREAERKGKKAKEHWYLYRKYAG